MLYLTKSTNWGKIPIVSYDGVIEVGAYIDFHETNGGTTDYDGRLDCVSGLLRWNGDAVYTSLNFTNLSQLTTRNFSDLQNKPTTLASYGIVDGMYKNTLRLSNTDLNSLKIQGFY